MLQKALHEKEPSLLHSESDESLFQELQQVVRADSGMVSKAIASRAKGRGRHGQAVVVPVAAPLDCFEHLLSGASCKPVGPCAVSSGHLWAQRVVQVDWGCAADAAPAMLRVLAAGVWRSGVPRVPRSGRSCPALIALRGFSREPADGTRARKALQHELHDFAAEQRLHDAWAWVGLLEDRIEKAKYRAKKTRRKMQYGNDPVGRSKREEQRKYWEEQAQR
eukprot:s1363_g8.t2